MSLEDRIGELTKELHSVARDAWHGGNTQAHEEVEYKLRLAFDRFPGTIMAAIEEDRPKQKHTWSERPD